MGWLTHAASGAGIASLAFAVFLWWGDDTPQTAKDQLEVLREIKRSLEENPPATEDAEALRAEAGDIARAAIRNLDNPDAYIERVYDGVFELGQGRAVELAGPDGIKVLFAVDRLRTANAGLVYVKFKGKNQSLYAGDTIMERNCGLTMVEHRQSSARFYWRCP